MTIYKKIRITVRKFRRWRALATINYNTLYEPIIHFEPVCYNKTLAATGERYPLYALSGDNSDSSGLSKLELKDLANRGEEWRNAVKLTYTSPTNLRLLALSTKGCLLGFHKNPIINGKPSTTGRFKKVSTQSALQYRLNIDKFDLNAAINSFKSGFGSNVRVQYTITGNPLRNLASPWITSNIEEVYVDVKLLITDKLLSQSKPVVNDDYIKQWAFDALNVSSINDLQKKFPRLRCIAVIPDLETMIAKWKPTDITISKLEAAKIMEKAPKLVTNIYSLSEDDVNISKPLIIRSYYKFDKEILSQYNRELQKKAALSNKSNDIPQSSISDNIKLNTELLFEQLEKTRGLEVARLVAEQFSSICKFGSAESRELNIQDLFSSDGYSRYFT